MNGIYRSSGEKKNKKKTEEKNIVRDICVRHTCRTVYRLLLWTTLMGRFLYFWFVVLFSLTVYRVLLGVSVAAVDVVVVAIAVPIYTYA